jgi:hypothetical protein
MQRESPSFINFDEFLINDLWKFYETILNEFETQQHKHHTLIHKMSQNTNIMPLERTSQLY